MGIISVHWVLVFSAPAAYISVGLNVDCITSGVAGREKPVKHPNWKYNRVSVWMSLYRLGYTHFIQLNTNTYYSTITEQYLYFSCSKKLIE